jgi:serpin B
MSATRLAFLGLLPLLALSPARAERVADRVPVRPRTVATFAGELHGLLAKAPGNLLYAPASIAAALAMTREGATGATADEMDRTLGGDLRSSSKALVADGAARAKLPTPPAGERPGPELVIANRLYADAATIFEAPFLAVTKDGYLAPTELVDFRKHREAARAKINAWVDATTHHKIHDLVPAGALDDLTRLVLVNAIYLKAKWQQPFVHEATAPALFTIDGGAKAAKAAKANVPTMHGDQYARSGAFAGGRLIDLPYATGGGEPLAMLVVVPDKLPLRDVEARYAAQGVAPMLAALQPAQRFAVAMPRFKVTAELELGDALAKLGMPRAFTDDAEFRGMSASTPLKISKVIHKAFCAVDEDGTEAAAATAVVMAQITSVEIAPPPFVVDRSFLFFIHDAQGRVLFAGRVVDPR